MECYEIELVETHVYNETVFAKSVEEAKVKFMDRLLANKYVPVVVVDEFTCDCGMETYDLTEDSYARSTDGY